MNKSKHSSSSLSALPKSKFLNQSNNKISRIKINSLSHLRLQKKPLLQGQNSIQVPVFIPRNRAYVQLSPEKSDVDFRARSLEKQKKSFESAIVNHKISEKVSDLKFQMRSFNLKSARLGILKKLEAIKTPPNNTDPNKIRFFFSLIKSGNLEKLTEVLQAEPSLVSLQDNLKQTALHWACRRGYLEIAKLLVQYKLSYAQQDILGRSPEDIARSKGQTEIIEYFSSIKRYHRQLSRRFY